MYLKRTSNFIIGDLYIDRGTFRNPLYNAIYQLDNVDGMIGWSSGQIGKILKSSIGEFHERFSLFYNPGLIKKDKLEAFNLVNGEKTFIAQEEILFNDRTKENSKSIFKDTSGMSFHYNSSDVLNSSFLEFFERQSLIYNWLTQSKGLLINPEKIKDKYINQLIKYTYKFVDELYLFNISIHRDVYVVFALSFGLNVFSIGLKADWDLESAVKGALEEMHQYFSTIPSKYHSDYSFLNNKKTEVYSKNKFFGTKFWDVFTPQTLRESYLYLFNKTENNYMNNKCNKSSFVERVAQISRDLDIDIYCFSIPTLTNVLSKSKVVKVFSPDGFPHINTTLYDPNNIKIAKVFGETTFPNKYKPIPFP